MIREANKNDLDEILQLYYKRATMEDIDELVRTRIIVLRAANKLSDDEDMSVVEEESYAYYRRALETGEHIAYLVYDNGAFVGAGGVSFYQVMPEYSCAAEPPVQCGVSHLSRRTEPHRL